MENSEVYFKRNNVFPTLVKALWISVFLAVLSRSSMRLTHKDAPGHLLEPTEMPHRDNTNAVCASHTSPSSFQLLGICLTIAHSGFIPTGLSRHSCSLQGLAPGKAVTWWILDSSPQLGTAQRAFPASKILGNKWCSLEDCTLTSLSFFLAF